MTDEPLVPEAELTAIKPVPLVEEDKDTASSFADVPEWDENISPDDEPEFETVVVGQFVLDDDEPEVEALTDEVEEPGPEEGTEGAPEENEGVEA